MPVMYLAPGTVTTKLAPAGLPPASVAVHATVVFAM
jgi:hypothetical protein